MKRRRYYYLIRIQYLGFRYSGWQKQPNQKTIEKMVLKTLKFILPNVKVKILSAGRTDAKVSALNGAFELFVDDHAIADINKFLPFFNQNLPPDIRVLDIIETNATFNIIKDSKYKEYVYLFSFGQKNHPFSAPFIANIIDDLDLPLMMKAARLFEGTHDFSAYNTGRKKERNAIRHICFCEIKPNTILSANFFPKESFALHISAEGFMRYQVRMIMGALIQLGKGALSIADIEASLKEKNGMVLSFVAPGSGLLLNTLEFK